MFELDDFLCEVNCEELEEEFEAWLQLQNEVQVKYLTSYEKCGIINI